MLRKLTEFAECTGTSKAYRDTYLRTPKSGYTGIPVISRTPRAEYPLDPPLHENSVLIASANSQSSDNPACKRLDVSEAVKDSHHLTICCYS